MLILNFKICCGTLGLTLKVITPRRETGSTGEFQKFQEKNRNLKKKYFDSIIYFTIRSLFLFLFLYFFYKRLLFGSIYTYLFIYKNKTKTKQKLCKSFIFLETRNKYKYIYGYIVENF